MTNLKPEGVLTTVDNVTSPLAYSVDDAGHYLLSLRMSPEAFERLDRIAETTHTDLIDVIAKAFILYRASFEAHREGKSVGIAPTPDVLETEFTGF